MDHDLGAEYADLVLAEEHGTDRYGEPALPNYHRRVQIEEIAERDGWDLTLDQFVSNALEDLKEAQGR